VPFLIKRRGRASVIWRAPGYVESGFHIIEETGRSCNSRAAAWPAAPMSTFRSSHFLPAVRETQGENRIRDRLIDKKSYSFQIVIDLGRGISRHTLREA
jgi:hypothetical protein